MLAYPLQASAGIGRACASAQGEDCRLPMSIGWVRAGILRWAGVATGTPHT